MWNRACRIFSLLGRLSTVVEFAMVAVYSRHVWPAAGGGGRLVHLPVLRPAHVTCGLQQHLMQSEIGCCSCSGAVAHLVRGAPLGRPRRPAGPGLEPARAPGQGASVGALWRCLAVAHVGCPSCAAAARSRSCAAPPRARFQSVHWDWQDLAL
jgi:hypothetical protein